jgi:hypothetical protein
MNILRIADRLAGACLLAALLGAALLSVGQLHAQGPTPEKLVISYVPGNAIYWDIDVAIEKGFFKDEGFAPEVVIFQSSRNRFSCWWPARCSSRAPSPRRCWRRSCTAPRALR